MYLQRAEAIARECHEGQSYGSRDYIEGHVKPVVSIIVRLGFGPAYQATGWLHDVVEDSEKTYEDLLNEGMPQRVVTAVELLTKPKGADRLLHLQKLAEDPIAIVAKFADSTVNLGNTALLSPDMPEDEFRRKMWEYSDNLAYIRTRLPETDIGE